jgi:hypothetical protein
MEKQKEGLRYYLLLIMVILISILIGLSREERKELLRTLSISRIMKEDQYPGLMISQDMKNQETKSQELKTRNIIKLPIETERKVKNAFRHYQYQRIRKYVEDLGYHFQKAERKKGKLGIIECKEGIIYINLV